MQPRGRRAVRRPRRARPARREGVRARRVGRPAAGQPVAGAVVPRRRTNRPPEPARAGRARGVRHAARRARRRARAAPRHRRQRRARRRPRRRPPGRRTAQRDDRASSPTPGWRRCGTTSARLHAPASSSGASTSTASCCAPTAPSGCGDLASASVADSPPTPCAIRPRRWRWRSSWSARSAPSPSPARRSATTACCAVLPYLQEAAMAPQVRDALGRRRHRARRRAQPAARDARRRGAAAHQAPPRHVGLACSTWRCSAIAAYTLIALLGDVDMETFVDELSDANWWWLAFALVLAQLPRIPSAVSTMGSIDRPLPLGPLDRPAVRHLLRQPGHPQHGRPRRHQRPLLPALRRQADDGDVRRRDRLGVAGFVVQIVLFLLLFFSADLDLGLSTTRATSAVWRPSP